MKVKPLILFLTLAASTPALAAPSLVYEASANVLEATQLNREVPITGRVCDDATDAPAAKESNAIGSVLGGLVGGLLGSQVGKGSGNKAAIATGAIAGAMVGGSGGAATQPAPVRCRETVTGYRTVSDGFLVRWQLNDQVRESVLPRDPGEILRVRVSMQPITPSPAGF